MKHTVQSILVNKKKSRRIILTLCVFICLWIIFGFNTDNADYAIYENWYNVIGKSGIVNRFEIGFEYTMLFFNKIGLNYRGFLIAYSFIGLAIISISVYKYSKIPYLVLVLYAFYPFLFDVVQIRNFMAEAIILYSLVFLKECNIKNIVLFSLLLIVAMLFHKGSFFYIFLLLAYLKDYKKIFKISIAIMFFLFAVVIFKGDFLVKILADDVPELYLRYDSSFFKVIGYFIFSFLTAFFIFVFKQPNKNNDYIQRVIPIMLISIPFILISAQFYRMFRNMVIIAYIVMTNYSINGYKSKYKLTYAAFTLSLFSLTFSLFFFIRQLSPFAPLYETVTKPIIEKNSLFNSVN